ncbi:MAG: GH3 auxin-responsive promoter family protein, partial [Phycisphaerae bacterium]
MNTPPIIRLRRLAWTPLRLRTSREAARWMKAVQHTPAVQARLLDHLLVDAARTDFGRDFSLGRVRTLEDFRAALPIAGYERARP